MPEKLAGVEAIVEAGLAPSRVRAYQLVAAGVIPPGVAVKAGRSVFINKTKLAEWIDRGGSVAPTAGGEAK